MNYVIAFVGVFVFGIGVELNVTGSPGVNDVMCLLLGLLIVYFAVWRAQPEQEKAE